MKNLRLFFSKPRNKGQSFVEMFIVLGGLLVLVLGVVEFGNLLNQYITLVDAARAGARFGSNNDPFTYTDASGNDITNYSYVQPAFYEGQSGIDTVIEGARVEGNAGALTPIILNAAEDQILITFFSTENGEILQTYGPWRKFPSNMSIQNSQVDLNFIEDSLSPSAPNTGILLVEIFYNYYQLLNMPFFTYFIPNPILVHAYAIMPLSAAEPTPVIP